MPARKRQPHTEAWDSIRQLCLWPEQKAYELLRPKSGAKPGEMALTLASHNVNMLTKKL
jgi:hypothetical protein